jgi:ubiquinone/menaquinone biosynthesis C-methylase UbiE
MKFDGNFDRVAEIYDETRRLPEWVIARVRDRVLEATGATPETRFLELGIGTGRIALPFIQLGYSYTGVDISRNMLEQLRQKIGEREKVTLVEGNIASLPFEDESFDVVVAVHILHLVADWREALAEVRRVLKPGGHFVLGSDGGTAGDPSGDARRQWRTLVEERGVSVRPEYGSRGAVEEELTAQGARIAVYRVAHWESDDRPLDWLEEQRNRIFSATWNVPEEVLHDVHQQMLIWATAQFGTVDRPVRSAFDFLLSVSRWPASGS